MITDAIRQYNREWREKNRERIAQKNRAYYFEHKEQFKQWSRRRYQLNKEKAKIANRRWYLKNREQAKVKAAIYAKANPDKVNTSAWKRIYGENWLLARTLHRNLKALRLTK